MTTWSTRATWRRLVSPPSVVTDVGERRTHQLVATLVVVMLPLLVAAALIALVVAPDIVRQTWLPLVGLLATFPLVYVLNRTRFRRLAALLLCSGPVWSNAAVGLTAPGDPVWYGFMPLSVVLAGALLRLVDAVVTAVLCLVAVAAVLFLRRDAYGEEAIILIITLNLVVAVVALGMAHFRARVEALRLKEVERLAGQLAATERLETIGRMAGGIAHDFNNLLTVIMTSAELVRRGKTFAIDEILAAGERAAALTRQLLAFSANRAMAAEVLQFDEVLAGLFPLLRRLVPENIELVLERGASWPVAAEESQLQQVILNLTANARDAMPSGGRLTISTREVSFPDDVGPPRRPGDHVQLTVRDDGAGMDAATQARAFEPFFTTKSIGSGTGLGLATVQAILRKAGGWVELDSAPGRGTSVTIALPRSLAAPRPTAPGAEPIKRDASGQILIVEDDPAIRKTACLLLESMGYLVVAAASAAEVARALDEARRPIDLLITDVVLPGISGIELAAQLRARWPDLPVVLISGYAEDDVSAALANPSTRFVPKPFTPAALASAASELLAARSAAAEQMARTAPRG